MSISRAFVGAGQLTTHSFELIALFIRDNLRIPIFRADSQDIMCRPSPVSSHPQSWRRQDNTDFLILIS